MNSSSRGIRNNNPFNIKKSKHPWIGKVNGNDPTFECFDNMYHGIRAGMKLLINYVERGFDTPEKIIKRFAPCNENNVSNYVDFVCRNFRDIYYITPSTRITSLSVLCIFASRMAKYECALSYPQLANYMLLSADLVSICNKFNLNKHGILTD